MGQKGACMLKITKTHDEVEKERLMVVVATEKGCPHCHSDNVKGWVHLVNRDTVVCKCFKCGTEWEDDEYEKV